MTAAGYQIRQCTNPACGLRYPLVEGHPFGERCPLCLGTTEIALSRSFSPEPVTSPLAPLLRGEGSQIEALLDNIRSGWNVGAMFRTADGLGVSKLYLCGITPTPENKEVRKTALGAEETVRWEYSRNALETARQLKREGCQLWALEQDARAVAIEKADFSADSGYLKRMVLIVGNEVTGVDPALLDLCDRIVHIPMLGQKRSLNVEVAFGVAVHSLLSQMR